MRFAFRQTADDLIEELVATEPKPKALTVVSNDSRVREAGAEPSACFRRAKSSSTGSSPRHDSPSASDAPEADKPEPTSTDVNELLNVFNKPKKKRSA